MNINFSEIFSFSHLSKMGNAIQLAICGLLVLAVCVVASFGGIKVMGTYDDLKFEQELEASKLVELQDKQKTFLMTERYEQAIEEAKVTLEVVKKRLPANLDAASFVEQLNKNAVETGIDVKSSTPLRQEKKSFYYEIPVEITGCATYHEVGDFVASLSRLERIITLDNFGMQNTSVPSESMPRGMLRYETDSSVKVPNIQTACAPGQNAFSARIATYMYIE